MWVDVRNIKDHKRHAPQFFNNVVHQSQGPDARQTSIFFGKCMSQADEATLFHLPQVKHPGQDHNDHGFGSAWYPKIGPRCERDFVVVDDVVEETMFFQSSKIEQEPV